LTALAWATRRWSGAGCVTALERRDDQNTGLPMLAGGCLPRLATHLQSACVAERCQASLAADACASGTEPNSCCRGWRRLCMLSGLAGAHVR